MASRRRIVYLPFLAAVMLAALHLSACDDNDPNVTLHPSVLQVGVAAVKLTPCGENPDWDGPVTANGVWGETFMDTNGNGRWDNGEPFVDDPVNTQLDRRSLHKYDGIFLAGFGNDRIATGCHDDLWARVLVLQTPTRKIALVSVDFVGELLHGTYYGFAKARALVDPALGLDTIVFSSTHDHEAPDTLGLWGTSEFVDGKFPHYLQFVDRQVAKAINAAAAPGAMHAATVIAGQTDPAATAELRGLQVRTGCRPPWFFDQEVRALRFVGGDGQTIATLINWNTHPESLEDANTEVSADFPGYLRARVEARLGGTAVYITGDLGAVEIVGDTCVGGADAHAADGSNDFDRRDHLGFGRTQQLGELVGDAVVKALQAGETLPVADMAVASANYYGPGSNANFALGNQLGILDLDPQAFDLSNCPPGTVICGPVEQHLITFSDRNGQPLVQMITAPGELFPELFYGVDEFHRTDCPAANTGEPYEPSIRNAMRAPFRFVIGLSPDEFGYIVPGYDFRQSQVLGEEVPDACQDHGYDANVPRRTVPSHYHESLSVGLDIAATTTCYALKLLGRDADVGSNDACRRALRLP